MLPRQHRIPLKKEFLRIKKTGHYLNGKFLTLLYSVDGIQSNSRFAVIISKQINKRAVIRNRIKRLVMAAIGLLINQFNQGGNFVFIVKPGIKDKTIEEIKMELLAFLKINNVKEINSENN